MSTDDQLTKRLKLVCNEVGSYASPSSRKQFLKAITCAAHDYLDLPDPVMVASEIRNLEEQLRKGSANPQALLGNLTLGVLELIEAHGKIPDFSILSDAVEIKDASLDLLGIVTSSSKKINQKSQKRTKHTPIGQISRGRPRHRREEFLVSRLATAYAAATGQPTSRSWYDDNQKDFEVVVALVLNALGVPKNISATKLVEQHIRNRDNPQ